MRRLLSIVSLLFVSMIFLMPAAARAAGAFGVQDDAHFFSPDAVGQADGIIQQIRSAHHKDVLVVTYEAVPETKQAALESEGKQKFFDTWAKDIARQHSVDGIIILMTRNPGHVQVSVGNQTRTRDFTLSDRDELSHDLLGAFGKKDFDAGLLSGVQFIQTRMSRNMGSAASAQDSQSSPAPASPPVNGTGGPAYPLPSSTTSRASGGFSMWGWLCAGVGILLVVFLVISALNRSRGGYGGGYGGRPGYPQQGGYPPGGYPQGGGYGGGGGGSGFGRGILGGLLGGALGAWGYDELSHRGGASAAQPPLGGGAPAGSTGGDFGAASQPDTDFSSTGGDFGSSAPDTSSSGGDFGGGGGDSGGGGSDFGSSGGDFGGGGGGDSGGGGGDF